MITTDEGRKIERVERKAPNNPLILYPMKVAVIKIGPGVIWPIAMESINSLSVSHPNWSTMILSR